MRARRRNLLRFSPIRLLITILSVTAIFLVYRNIVHKAVHGEREYEFQFPLDQFELSVSAPLIQPGTTNRELRLVKLSLPIELTRWGCEFMFGAAVYSYPADDSVSTFSYRYDAQRFLFKFKYDLKSKRCESKDLTIATDEIPSEISLQLVQLELSGEALRETPLEMGITIRIAHDDGEKFSLTAGLASVSPAYPFLRERVTTRNSSFSVTPGEREEVMPLIHPADDLSARFQAEVERSIQRCTSGAGCGSIHGAIAEILDPSLLEGLERARAAGIDVDVISNFASRSGGLKADLKSSTRVFRASPWNWLRGNPMVMNTGERLPMHLKFLIFDRETVISSNSNFNFETFGFSREVSMLYRSPAIASIFEEIWTMARTTLFYPVKIDRRAPVTILFNADRPRGYSASDRKPYLSIRTEDGESANAYGILFDLLDRERGPLTVAMSPITDYCAAYNKMRCLFDLLSQRREAGMLTEILNVFFYQDANQVSRDDGEMHLIPKFVETLSSYPAKPKLMALSDSKGSLHHERLAILGQELSIVGSANWARPSSLNTIEIVRDPSINARFRSELSTVSDPYFVALENKSVRDAHGVESHGCRFFFERDVFNSERTAGRSVDAERLRSLLDLGLRNEKLFIVEPESIAETGGSYPKFSLRDLPHAGKVRIAASYLCLYAADSNRSEVVLAPQK